MKTVGDPAVSRGPCYEPYEGDEGKPGRERCGDLMLGNSAAIFGLVPQEIEDSRGDDRE